MPRIIHFELPADNPERAVEFYSKVFGWKMQKWEGPTEYWLISTGDAAQPGINGGLLRRPYPGAVTCNTLDVASVDEAVANVGKNGGKTVAPKMAIPGVGYLAYCSDTEGNIFGVMQADTKAH
jgi:predicted enzyme related to lactoylglutathione lyase